MKKLTVFTLTAVIALFSAYSTAHGAELNSFKNLTAYTTGDNFRLVLTFDKEPKSNVRYFEKSIQIDLADTRMHPAKKEFDINRAGIGRINVYQFNPTTVRLRIFPDGDMETLRENIAFHKRGNKLVAKVSPPAARQAEPVKTEEIKKETSPKSAHSPDALIIKEEAPASPALPEKKERPVKLIKEETKTETAQAVDKNNKEESAKKIENYLATIKQASMQPEPKQEPSFLNESEPAKTMQIPSLGGMLLKVGSALMIVMSLVLVVGWGAKKYLARLEGGLGGKKQVKVLSNHFIGVKKNVTMVEIAGEVLVLGVTTTNISLLAHYTDKERVEEIKFTHRLPDKPAGIFKKFPLVSRLTKRKEKMNPAFAKKVESYAATLKEKDAENGGPQNTSDEKPSKEEMVSNVARAITERLDKIQEADA